MYTYDQHRQQLKYVKVDGGRMAYMDKGEGPTLLLVHGVPTSSWLYRHMIDALVGKGYRVIIPDLLGFGASDKPKGYEIYSEERQGKRLLSLMNHLQIDSWTQIIHDGGGLWTWEMLQHDPSGVQHLIILNTIIYDEGFKPPLRFEKGWWAKLYTYLYKSAVFHKLMINATLNNGLKKSVKLSKADKEGYYRPMREGANKALYYFFTQTCNELPKDYDDLLQSLTIPALVIWGMEDPMLTWTPMADRVIKDLGIKEQNVKTISTSKHFIQEEEPHQIVNWIDQFLKNQ